MNILSLPKVLNLTILLALCSAGIVSAADQDREGKFLTAGSPIFPVYCLNQRLQGYVDFEFVVDAKGRVRNPVALDAVVYRKSPDEPVDDEKARQAFTRAAINSLAEYRYEPPIRNGQAMETAGVKTRINFAIED
jgi:hypothetical protein